MLSHSRAVSKMTQRQAAIPMNRSTVDLPAETDPLRSQKSSSKFVEGLKWAVSFPAMLGMFLLGRVFYEGRGFAVDPDVWWHIKVGQDISSDASLAYHRSIFFYGGRESVDCV